MLSESVYYMDRSQGVLVTDRQVVIDGRRYELALIKDARIRSKRSEESAKAETYLRGVAIVTLFGAMAVRAFAWGSLPGQVVFSLDMLAFTLGLIGLLIFGLNDKPRRVVELRKLHGKTEELFDYRERRYAGDFVQAVTDAARDCRSGHGGNARAVYRHK